MTKREKRVERLRRLPPTMSYRDVAAILLDHGWTEARQVGSHHQWTKPGYDVLTVAEHGGKVKTGALRAIRELIDQEERT